MRVRFIGGPKDGQVMEVRDSTRRLAFPVHEPHPEVFVTDVQIGRKHFLAAYYVYDPFDGNFVFVGIK